MSLMFEVHALGKSTSVHPPFSTLEKAKAHGSRTAHDGSAVWIEGTVVNTDPEKPVPMWGLRYDRTVNTWIETSLPLKIEELFNDEAPCTLL